MHASTALKAPPTARVAVAEPAQVAAVRGGAHGTLAASHAEGVLPPHEGVERGEENVICCRGSVKP